MRALPHTLITKALGPQGTVVGVSIIRSEATAGRLNLEVTRDPSGNITTGLLGGQILSLDCAVGAPERCP